MSLLGTFERWLGIAPVILVHPRSEDLARASAEVDSARVELDELEQRVSLAERQARERRWRA